jgi:hypothetical protein
VERYCPLLGLQPAGALLREAGRLLNTGNRREAGARHDFIAVAFRPTADIQPSCAPTVHQ